MNKLYSFKKNYEIGKLVKEAKKIRGRYYIIYYKKYPKFEAAYSVSKKFGSAPERNYAKRVVRESIRQIPHIKEKGFRLLIVVQIGSKQAAFQDKKSELEKLIKELK
jgi:ribonuclease P protein component